MLCAIFPHCELESQPSQLTCIPFWPRKLKLLAKDPLSASQSSIEMPPVIVGGDHLIVYGEPYTTISPSVGRRTLLLVVICEPEAEEVGVVAIRDDSDCVAAAVVTMV